jgi:hypothetical protein
MDGVSFVKSAARKRLRRPTMFNMKNILKAASLVALAAAGLGAGAGTASAAPWDHRHDGWARHERMEHRAYVNRLRVADTLRFHRYRVMSDPFFLHGRYVVRVHDRFGRPVLVQVNPYTGAFIRVL